MKESFKPQVESVLFDYSLLSDTGGFNRITPSWAQVTARTPSRRHSRPCTSPREPPVGKENGENGLYFGTSLPGLQRGLTGGRACPTQEPIGIPTMSLLQHWEAFISWFKSTFQEESARFLKRITERGALTTVSKDLTNWPLVRNPNSSPPSR